MPPWGRTLKVLLQVGLHQSFLPPGSSCITSQPHPDIHLPSQPLSLCSCPTGFRHLFSLLPLTFQLFFKALLSTLHPVKNVSQSSPLVHSRLPHPSRPAQSRVTSFPRCSSHSCVALFGFPLNLENYSRAGAKIFPSLYLRCPTQRRCSTNVGLMGPAYHIDPGARPLGVLPPLSLLPSSEATRFPCTAKPSSFQHWAQGRQTEEGEETALLLTPLSSQGIAPAPFSGLLDWVLLLQVK